MAPGIAIGTAVAFVGETFRVSEERVEGDEAEAEVERFEEAVAQAERELTKIAGFARDKLGESSAAIFHAQTLVLHDAALHDDVHALIRDESYSADFAVQTVIGRTLGRLEASPSEYLRDRAGDLMDVQNRLLRTLQEGKGFSNIESGRIVVAKNLTAADLLLFSRREVLGCAMDFGGGDLARLDHGARARRAGGRQPARVLARCRRGRADHPRRVLRPCRPQPDGRDGSRRTASGAGTVPARPSTPGRSWSPAPSRDPRRPPDRAPRERRAGAGIPRSSSATGPRASGCSAPRCCSSPRGGRSTRPEQLAVYREAIRARAPAPDDVPPPRPRRRQDPPDGAPRAQPGARLARYPHPARQARPPPAAAPRDSPRRRRRPGAYPPPDGLGARRGRALPHLPCRRRRLTPTPMGCRTRAEVEVGIMVEVPAVVLLLDRFAPEVDFLSIGSNDLTQFTLAADRGNDPHRRPLPRAAPGRAPAHRAGGGRGRAARTLGQPLCGEMASNPRALQPLLVGLGLSELSASPAFLLDVKRARPVVLEKEDDRPSPPRPSTSPTRSPVVTADEHPGCASTSPSSPYFSTAARDAALPLSHPAPYSPMQDKIAAHDPDNMFRRRPRLRRELPRGLGHPGRLRAGPPRRRVEPGRRRRDGRLGRSGATSSAPFAARPRPVPISVVRDYVLPASVGEDALVIASSYSGGTEETLAAYDEAGRRGATVAVVTFRRRAESAGRARRERSLRHPRRDAAPRRAGLLARGDDAPRPPSSACAPSPEAEFGEAERVHPTSAPRPTPTSMGNPAPRPSPASWPARSRSSTPGRG